MLALAAFAVLFLRLWALQILSGAQYLHAAQNNQLRTVRVEAPRGPILDRKGRVLVSNVAGTAIQVWPADLPKRGRLRVLRRLASVLGVPLPRILRELREAVDPLTPVTVTRSVTERQVAYLLEHQAEFRGVQIAETYQRDYEQGALAAQLLGYVGEISPEQLKRLRRQGYRLGDTIGQAGVEAAYDEYLRGVPGMAQMRVDSLGRPRSTLRPRRQPHAGYAIRTTIDLRLQRAAERAIVHGIQAAHEQDNWYANGGAIVALDPRDGAVLAMASNPTYEPSVYVERADARKLAPLLQPGAAKEANYPGLNRATAGLYPPGSTFKPVTALAAMEEHVLSPYDTLPCTSQVTIAEQVFRNWTYMNEAMTLPTALETSCDTYFYQLGYAFYRLPPERGHPLQFWARRVGFGQPTGLDIGGEESGLLPTPEWRRATFKAEIDRIWKPGDSVQLAIGQKDLLVTPLQMARFYALVANGGKLVTPHVVANVEQPGAGGPPERVLRRFAPPARDAGVDPAALAVLRDGLFQATHGTNGTSTSVFGTFPVPIAGKTGTAEKAVDIGDYRPLIDQSWWCGYGPADRPELVVCAVIENGGFGATAAAPAALRVFEEYFGVKAAAPTYVPAD